MEYICVCCKKCMKTNDYIIDYPVSSLMKDVLTMYSLKSINSEIEYYLCEDCYEAFEKQMEIMDEDI